MSEIKLTEKMAVKSKHRKGKFPTKIFAWFVSSILVLSVFVYLSFFVVAKYEKYYPLALQRWNDTMYSVGTWFSGEVAFASVTTTPRIHSWSQQDIRDLVERYSRKYGVHPLVTWAIIDKESAGYIERVRYESTWKNQYSSKWKREPWMINDEEYNMLFSSYGLMQVSYGLHKEFCGLKSVIDLFDPEVNLNCGLKKISTCLSRNEETTEPARALFHKCFREYNGSGPRAEAYANDMISRLERYVFESTEYKLFNPGRADVALNPEKKSLS